MEVKHYINILLNRWWIVVAGFGVVFLGALLFTLTQPRVYEARATFVMRPRSEIIVDDEFVRALDVVSRRVEINTTFAEVVSSKLIARQAFDTMGLTSEQRQGLSANGRVVGGTNILEVTARGPDPELVRDFVNTVGERTVAYVGGLYDVFELEPLDDASAPRNPVQPNHFLNLTLGALFGLGMGVGLAFLYEYLSFPDQEREVFNIIDRESGAYNRSYLMHRLWQEMSRSKRNEHPLALGMIKLEIGDRDEDNTDHRRAEALRMVKILAERSLRPEDVMARFDDETLAILLPEMSEMQAQFFMEELNLKIESVPRDTGGGDRTLHLRTNVSAVAYENYRMKEERFLERAVRQLEETLRESEWKESFVTNNHN